jgi:hypothetical protein
VKRNSVFGVSFDDFIRELFVRTMMDKEMPDYIYPISGGTWNIAGLRVPVIHTAALNSVLCKFAMHDHLDVINSLIEDSLLQSERCRRPYYMRSTTRLSSELPSVLNRYVPVSTVESLVHDNIEEFPSITSD